MVDLRPRLHGVTVAVEGAAAAQRRGEAGRLRAFDGLRGIASLAVVLTHVLLAAPPASVTPSEHYRNPLRILWGLASDGSSAVCVFFVLSGVVLTLPFLRPRSLQDWVAYYPRRVVRLYVPVWASIVLAIGWYLLVPPRSAPWLTDWVQSHDQPILVRPLVRAFLLQRTTFLNSPLWSLTWEVLFSLLLPLYVVLARRGRAIRAGLLAAAVVATGIGSVIGSGALTMLPQFLVGSLIAAEVATLRRRSPSWLTTAVLVIGGLVLTQVAGYLDWTGTSAPGWAWPLRTLGCLLLVLAFLVGKAPRHLADHVALQWLGRISFSLYLVHEPLVVSLRLLGGPHMTYLQLLVLAVPASLLLAMVFYWGVEQRAHVLSRWVGAMTARHWPAR